MKSKKHSNVFDTEYTYYVRKQMKKNAEMLRKSARRNKVKLQGIPLIVHELPDDFPPEAA